MNELKVTFYLKKNERRADDTVPVLGRIRIGKSMVQFSAKVYVPEKLWDIKSGRAKGKSRAAQNTNAELEKLCVAIHSAYKELKLMSDNVLAVDVKNSFQGIASEQDILVKHYEHLNDKFYQKVGISRSIDTYKRYCVALNHLKNFLQKKYNVRDMAFQSLNPTFVKAFDLYLRSDLKMASNTIVSIVARLHLVIKSAMDNGLIRQDPFMDYKYVTEPLVAKCLSEKEFNLILTTPLPKDNMNLVRDVFIFSCMTGLAFSDLRNLTPENMKQAEDGVWWIHTARKKTGTPCHIPLMELPLQLIEKYRGISDKGRLFPMLSCSKTNINLKKIAKVCGIERCLTFHQARHNFGSLITLSQGVPLESVCKMMGTEISAPHSCMRN
jgi:tyrosine type site-specific recombinase